MGTTIYDPRRDPRFQAPYIDEDTWQERPMPDGSTIPFRCIHGGFTGTGVKFLFCFPEAAQYRGRFYQYLSPFPGPDEERASLGRLGVNDRIGFCLAHGAISVESNMGSTAMFGGQTDATLCWKASAAAAEYARVKAREIYGEGRVYGYVYGGSGGGYKTLACVENTASWDGAVPYVIGSPYSLPNTITMHVQGQRVLRRSFQKLLDVLDAGGSGDVEAVLDAGELQMFRELTAMGFPPLAWYLEAGGRMDSGSLPVLLPGVKAMDPGYFTDFWTVPGYLGAAPNSAARRDRLQFEGVVRSVHLPARKEPERPAGQNGVDDAWKKQLADGRDGWIELEAVPRGENLYLEGVNITVTTGAAAGKTLLLGGMIADPDGPGGCLTLGLCYGMDDVSQVLRDLRPGDRVFLDNSDYIALQSYYRHQVPPDLSCHAWDQFRGPDGTPTLPQRPVLLGPGFTGTGMPQDGNIQCPVLNLQALMDESTCPWCADWYRHKVEEAKGSLEWHRVYYMERCMHGDTDALQNDMVVGYMGALYQALLDLADWVERGAAPLPSSKYFCDSDGQIRLDPSIETRGGLQSVVELQANGAKCARVRPGETVRLTVDVKVPAGAGAVTGIAFSDGTELEPDRLFRQRLPFEPYQQGPIHGAKAEIAVRYHQPGTYFPVVRVQTHRQGDASDCYCQILNLDRARVMVE